MGAGLPPFQTSMSAALGQTGMSPAMDTQKSSGLFGGENLTPRNISGTSPLKGSDMFSPAGLGIHPMDQSAGITKYWGWRNWWRGKESVRQSVEPEPWPQMGTSYNFRNTILFPRKRHRITTNEKFQAAEGSYMWLRAHCLLLNHQQSGSTGHYCATAPAKGSLMVFASETISPSSIV